VQDFHRRDGDLLPLAADIQKQAAWRRCSKNWRLSFRAAFMKELQVAGVSRTFHRGWQGMDIRLCRPQTFADQNSATERNFPPIKSYQSGIKR
jgi:hypothetical protein